MLLRGPRRWRVRSHVASAPCYARNDMVGGRHSPRHVPGVRSGDAAALQVTPEPHEMILPAPQ